VAVGIRSDLGGALGGGRTRRRLPLIVPRMERRKPVGGTAVIFPVSSLMVSPPPSRQPTNPRGNITRANKKPTRPGREGEQSGGCLPPVLP